VQERLKLRGTFLLDQVRFASLKIQDSIRQLSLRGQGRPKELKSTDPTSILSSMQGEFQMGNGVIALPTLSYRVPGATIQLKGSYGMQDGALNFAGTATLQATVSQIAGGWLGILLKPADRILSKPGAGTEVPIHISGTREDPQFGIDFKRIREKPQENPTP
jgi:hypothetical protein